MARPTISLEAAIGSGEPDSNLFIIGTSLIGGTDVLAGAEIVGQGTWVELADRCYSLSTRRGRQRLLEQYAAGTIGAALDNTDGLLDPAVGEGAQVEVTDEFGNVLVDEFGNRLYVDFFGEGYAVKPMRALRATLTYEGTVYPLFYGYTDQWKATPYYPESAAISVTATDAFKIFTRINPLEQSPVGAGEDTGARITRILNLAEWSLTMRDIDTGDNTHQATNLAQPIATQMRLASDSERGDLYIDARGYPTFRRRLSRYSASRSLISQWTIGDGAGELNPAGFEVSNDDDLVRNDVNVARVGGSVQTRRSAEGEIAYLRSSYYRTDLTLEDDVQVVDHAERVLHLFQTQQPRVNSVTMEPDGPDDHELWMLIVDARFGDRVTVNLRHPGTRVLFVGDYFIEGIDHDIPTLGPGQWRTTFSLADASLFPTNPFIIGTSLIGGTDVLV